MKLWVLVLILFLVAILVGMNVYVGDSVPELVMRELRWPRALSALLAGACLGVSGLLLQTLFKNPLAGPDLLGVQSGAALGVGAWMALNTGAQGAWALGPWFFAALGALAVTGALMLLAMRARSSNTLLLAGVVLSSFSSSALGLLIPILEANGLRSYLMWGLGSFERLSSADLPAFAAICAVGLALSALLIRPLNALLAGEEFARSLWGMKGARTRLFAIVAVASLLAALVTVACGPVSLVGLLAPHLARWVLGRGHHKLALPGAALTGSLLALSLQFMATHLPWPSLTINALAGTFGLPAVLYLLLKKEVTV